MDNKDIVKIAFQGSYLNKSLRTLIFANTTVVFAIGLFAPFYAVFVKHIGGSVGFAGFSWALMSIVSGVLILLFTDWELHVKEQKRLLGLGYLLRAFVFLSYAFIGSMYQLIFTQIIWGLAAALSTPAFDSIYTAHTNKESSIAQWGGWEGRSAIVTGVAALVGGFIIQFFGFSAMFFGMSFICFLIAIYVWKLPQGIL